MSTYLLTREAAPTRTTTRMSWSDKAGIIASCACAVHCAAMPLVIGYLPTLSVGLFAGEAFHRWMAGACFLLAASAFRPGYRRHGKWTPAVLGMVGVGFLTGAAFGAAGPCCPSCETLSVPSTDDAGVCCSEDCPQSCTASETDVIRACDLPRGQNFIPAQVGPWLTPLGGVLLVMGHFLNHRSCRCCGPMMTASAVCHSGDRRTLSRVEPSPNK
jgi:hypothetical protein